MTSEKRIQNDIRLGLQQAFPELVLWRNNVGKADYVGPSGNSRSVLYGLGPGSADLVGVMGPRGRFVAIEVKRPGNKARPNQEVWLELVRSNGGVAFVADSAASAIRQLGEALT